MPGDCTGEPFQGTNTKAEKTLMSILRVYQHHNYLYAERVVFKFDVIQPHCYDLYMLTFRVLPFVFSLFYIFNSPWCISLIFESCWTFGSLNLFFEGMNTSADIHGIKF